MPSPFPGMDPYLENPDVFPNLHDKLIVHLEEAIQPLLPEPYYAKGAQRIWLEFQEASRIPDVSVLSGSRPSAPVPDEGGGVAVADVPVKITAPYQRPWHEHHEAFLEIYTKAEGGPRLVTAIEVLSPTNKSPGHSRSAYHNKQGELHFSSVNLVEIDLLRAGAHTTAVPRQELVKRCGEVDYHICVHLFEQPKDFYIYPIRLPDRLPKISIPLLPGDVPVAIDLQAVFDQCYDRGPYRREVSYAGDPPPPALTAERLEWVKSVLAGQE